MNLGTVIRTVVVAQKATLAKTIARYSDPSFQVTNVSGHILRVKFKNKDKAPWLKTPLKQLLDDPFVFAKSESAKSAFDNLNRVSKKKIDHLIIATDPDQQGHKIGFDVMNHIKQRTQVDKVSRMLLESVTKKDVIEGYANLKPMDPKEALPAQLRSRLDLLFGSVLTRFASLDCYRRNKAWRTFNTGRVQTPTLKYVVDREKQIRDFKAEVYYLARPLSPEFEHLLLRFNAKDARPSRVTVKLKKEEPYVVNPFEGLNTDLLLRCLAKQHSCFKKLGKRVTDLLSSMYLEGKISYPRTQNRSYGNYQDLLHVSADLYTQSLNKAAIIPKLDRKKGDHGPVSPLVPLTFENLNEFEKKVLITIYRHLEKVFSGPNRYLKLTYQVQIQNKTETHVLLQKVDVKFADGLKSVNKAPRTASVVDLEYQEKLTVAKPRYSASTLLRAMQLNGLGTKSTRALIIDQLINHRYLYYSEDHLFPSKAGVSLVSYWERVFARILSSELTKEIQNAFESLKGSSDVMDVQAKYRTYLYESLVKLNEH